MPLAWEEAPVPSSPADADAILLFAVAWCVRVRLGARDRDRHKQQCAIRLVAEDKIAKGYPLQACDVDTPSNSYFAPCEPTSPHDLGKAENMTLFHATVARRKMYAIASWLFDFFHDDPVVMTIKDCRMPPACPAYSHSAVGPLRATCRQWANLLPLLHCCRCGGDYRIGDFRGWWGFTRWGHHGYVPCHQCYNICSYHLSCSSCENQHRPKRMRSSY